MYELLCRVMVSKLSHYTASWSRKKWLWGRLISQATQGRIDKSSTMCICAKSDTGQSHTFYLNKKSSAYSSQHTEGKYRDHLPRKHKCAEGKRVSPGFKGRFHWNAAHTGAQCCCRQLDVSFCKGSGRIGKKFGEGSYNPLNRVICQIGKAVNCRLRGTVL